MDLEHHMESLYRYAARVIEPFSQIQPAIFHIEPELRLQAALHLEYRARMNQPMQMIYEAMEIAFGYSIPGQSKEADLFFDRKDDISPKQLYSELGFQGKDISRIMELVQNHYGTQVPSLPGMSKFETIDIRASIILGQRIYEKNKN